ncbi:MAG: response regulator transcription factor [Bacteroidota bacterium]
MSDSPTLILVVDDHELVRMGLDKLFENEPDLHVAAHVETSDDALQLIDRRSFDFIIVDIGLKGGSGLDLIRHIRARNETVPILVLSMHREAYYAERVLRAGAQGYLSKQGDPETIIPAIRQILGGDLYVSPSLADDLVRRAVDGGDARKSVEDLSDRETEVVRFIGQGLSTREIAEQLSLSVKTIESYRANVKRKLGLQTGAELSRFAYDWTSSALGLAAEDPQEDPAG